MTVVFQLLAAFTAIGLAGTVAAAVHDAIAARLAGRRGVASALPPPVLPARIAAVHPWAQVRHDCAVGHGVPVAQRSGASGTREPGMRPGARPGGPAPNAAPGSVSVRPRRTPAQG
jgi:hypothetical protein